MRTALFLILSASWVVAQPKPPTLLEDALRKLPGVHVLEPSLVNLRGGGTADDLKRDGYWHPWAVADLDRDGIPDVAAAVVKRTPSGTQYGVLAVHARTPMQVNWMVPLDTTPINGVVVGGFFGPDTVEPLYCYRCDANPWFRWSGHAYELELFSVGQTFPLGSSTERIIELFTESRLKSGIAGKVVNCMEAKILATTGTSRDTRWYQVEVRGPKLQRGWVRAKTIDTGACIG